MWQWIITLALSLYVTCMSQNDPPETSTLASTDKVYNIYDDGLKVQTFDMTHAHVALIAMDRQCGNCHHPDRSTNQAALAIFDLTDECWYCPLSSSQVDEVKSRTKSPKFSEEEQVAISSLLDQLADSN